MFSDVFLAQTGWEINQHPTDKAAYLACHFSSYGKGLSNFPEALPSGSILLLDDSMPPNGHDSRIVEAELKEKVEYGKGIRIFRQDTYETVISFIISANNNIKRIQKIIEKLCERVGEKKNGFYAFPTAKQLQSLSVEDFKDLGLGYRAQYLYETSRVIDDMIDIIKSQDTEQATKSLLSLKGVGPKVANCILLFGLYKTNSYPVDTWIFKANKTEELNTEKKVLEYYQKRYGEYAGFAQQYVFFYAREKGLQNKKN